MSRTIAIFGATGRTGSRVLNLALQRGDQVRALARDPSRVPGRAGGLTVVAGDVLDLAPVTATIEGSDAVISVIGHVKNSPSDVQMRGIRTILDAMGSAGVSRLISLTGAGVRDPGDTPGVADKLFRVALKLVSGTVLADAEAHRDVLAASAVDWTIVRVPRLTEKPGTGQYRVGRVGGGSGTQLSRDDLADFLLTLTGNTSFRHELPFLST